MQKEEPDSPVPPFLLQAVADFLFESFDKFENSIVCGISDLLSA